MNFDLSLFTKICEMFKGKEKTPVLQLTEQFRMHPEIFKFPNSKFYGNMVNHKSVHGRTPKYPFLTYALLNVETSQALTQDTSAYNLQEVDFVKFLVEVLIKEIPKQMSIGIITPYTRQNSEINRRIAENDRVSIYTIDAAQGLEKDVVILALTRSEGVGFLDNPKRINVALTRARRALYVCGNFSSLSVSSRWGSLKTDDQNVSLRTAQQVVEGHHR
jgi:senataxin